MITKSSNNALAWALLILLIIFGALAVILGGEIVNIVNTGTGTVCPIWSGYKGTCALKIEKRTIEIRDLDLKMGLYQKQRFTITNEVIFKNSINISLTTDAGELIGKAPIHLVAGSYIVTRNKDADIAGFTLANPEKGIYTYPIYLIAEYVAPETK
jgi:hypothetical protein